MTRRQFAAVCTYEAGHATIAAALGFRVLDVSLAPRRGFLGLCTVDWDSPAALRATPEDRAAGQIMVRLAGPVAQERAGFGDLFPGGDTTDRTEAWKVAVSVVGSRRAALALLDRLTIGTDRLVYAAWPGLYRLAGALAKYGSLTGEQAERILAGNAY